MDRYMDELTYLEGKEKSSLLQEACQDQGWDQTESARAGLLMADDILRRGLHHHVPDDGVETQMIREVTLAMEALIRLYGPWTVTIMTMALAAILASDPERTGGHA